jgi:hypothetical protein
VPDFPGCKSARLNVVKERLVSIEFSEREHYSNFQQAQSFIADYMLL